jgi:hypothetical protein
MDGASLVPLFVLWCVYMSDALWWTCSDCLVLTGTEIGRFRARLGPSWEVRDGKGLLVLPLLPPFKHSFECSIAQATRNERRPTKRIDVERRVTEALKWARPVRRAAEILWFYLFVIGPVVIGTFGIAGTWPLLLAVLLALLALVIVLYRRSWLKVYGPKSSAWRSDAILLMLSPPGATRAADRLTRKAFADLGGLRVLSVVAPAHEFCRVARGLYFDDVELQPAGLRSNIDDILDAERLTAAFFAAPEREPGMDGFCCRCHGQVMRATGNCPDCVTVSVTPFETSQAPALQTKDCFAAAE